MPHSRRASRSRRPLRNRPENKARSKTPRHIPAAFAGQKDACKNKGPRADTPAGRYRLSCAQPSGAPVRTSPCLPRGGPCRCPRRRCGRRRNPASRARPMRHRRGHAGQARDTRTACGFPDYAGVPPAGGCAPARAAQRPSVRRGGPSRVLPPGKPDAGRPLTRRPAAWTRVRRTQRSGRPGAHRSANGGGRAGTPYAFPGRSPEPSPLRSIQFRRKPSFGNGLSYR